MRILIWISTVLLATTVTVSAQTSRIKIDKNLIYEQGKSPEKVDNYNYTSFYTAGKNTYNLKGYPISSSLYSIIDFKVNPAGYSYAVLTGNGKKFNLTIYDTNIAKHELAKSSNFISPSAITYSPNSRSIYVADNGQIRQFESKSLKPERSFQISSNPIKLIIDPLGLYLVCLYPEKLEVYNLEEGVMRKSLPIEGTLVDASFSKDGDIMAAITSNGTLDVYNTRDFNRVIHSKDLGNARSVSVHPEGKYVAVATDEHRVQFVNLIDDFDRPYITDPTGPRTYAKFLTDSKGDVFLTFDADKAIIYKRLSGFQPNFSKYLREQVEDKMREWMKMRPMETEEEYRLRVSPENIEKQRKLFANEIATSLAGDLINHGTVTLGKYNPQSGLLAINIGNLPTIYLQVPKEDMPTFGDGTNLKFSDEVFCMTPKEQFELIYVNVFNPTNGKNYTFDNLEGQNLDFLATDDSFVSLDLVLQSNREDVMLRGIKDKIVADARANNLISEHTDISVDAHIEPAYDANGRRINNYHVRFDYKVEPEYSEQEDFPSGKYLIEQSNAAKSMMRIVKQAFENDFSTYLESGKKLIVDITGSADGSPINHGIVYDGIYGIYDNEPVKLNGEFTSISVSPESSIRTNEQLAFVRALAVKNDMEHKLPQFANMNTEYRYNIEVSKDRGGQYRRISLELIFIDAF